MKREKDQTSKLVGMRVDEAKIKELGPSFFADLPSAITSHILCLLPIKSLLICKCVCKTWSVVISDPHFAKLHFERAPTCLLIRTNDPKRVSRTLHLLEYEPEKFDDNEEDQFCCCKNDFLKHECNNHVKLEPKFKLPLREAKLVLNKRDEAKNSSRQRHYIACKPKDDKFDVVSSCNGILCLRGPSINDPLVVCNPITGEFIKLPEAPEIDKTQGLISNFYVGLGFQPKTNEYKVVRMWKRHTHRRETYEQIVEIHTLGTPTWRYVGVDPTFQFESLAFPTYLNGALHWIKSDDDDLKKPILCFNFESERFLTFPSPFENDESSDYIGVSMGELKGFLYICEPSSLFDSGTIWIMKKYGIGESWTNVFYIDLSVEHYWPDGLYLPVKHFRTDACMLMYCKRNCVVYYESKKYGFKFYKVRGTTSKFEVIPYIPSLIALKDAVKGDNVEVLNVRSRCAKFILPEENEVLFLAQKRMFNW